MFLFPNSKILLIIRDIHAHCASLKRHLDNEHRQNGKRRFVPEDPKGCWSSWNSGGGVSDQPCYPHDLSLLPEMWLRLNKLAINDLRVLPSENYKIISYETLITEQKKTLMSVFDFLDLLPEYKKEANKAANKEIGLINTTTIGDSLKKWKQQLTPSEITTITKVIEANRSCYDNIMAAAQSTTN